MTYPQRTSLITYVSLLIIILIVTASCSNENSGKKLSGNIDLLDGVDSNIHLSNPEFANGGFMSGVYTCYGLNRSPEVSWTGLPSGTMTLTLIVSGIDSPNEPNQIHWVLYNLPHDFTMIPSNIAIY